MLVEMKIDGKVRTRRVMAPTADVERWVEGARELFKAMGIPAEFKVRR